MLDDDWTFVRVAAVLLGVNVVVLLVLHLVLFLLGLLLLHMLLLLPGSIDLLLNVNVVLRTSPLLLGLAHD